MSLKLDDLIPRLLFRTPLQSQTYEHLATVVLSEHPELVPIPSEAPKDLYRKVKESVDRLVMHGWVHKRFESVVLSHLGNERLRAEARN